MPETQLPERLDFGFNRYIGAQVVSASKDKVVGRFTASSNHVTDGNRVHGGALMAFADMLGAYGAILNLPSRAATATLESKTNFLRPSAPGDILGEATPLHVGRRTMVWQTTLHDAKGRCIAVVTQTQMVFDADEADVTNGEGTASERAEATATEGARQLEQIAPNNLADGNLDGRSSSLGQRRERIMEAAFPIIAEKGFANASMREIAQAAGMPIPTMYQYVRNKDDILVSIFETYIGEVQAGVGASTQEKDTARDKLEAAIERALDRYDAYQAQIRVMNRETRSLAPSIRERVKEDMMEYIGIFENIIEEGRRNGEFRDINAKMIANIIIMMLEVWPLRQWSIGRFGLKAVQHELIDLVMHGVLRHDGQRT